MQTGVVKWFNNAKGYGFILTDIENKDVFAHYSAVEMDGYRTLRAGQCVAFEAVDGPKGLHAASIKILAEAPDVSGEPKNADISLTAPLSNGLDTDITPILNEETESAIQHLINTLFNDQSIAINGNKKADASVGFFVH